MHSDTNTRFRLRLRALSALGAILGAVVLAACGSAGSNTTAASGSAASLLQQTFGSTKHIQSGVLAFDLTVDPSGSSTFTTPIELSLSGPFQSHGTGHVPSVDFTARVSALGKQGSLGIILTGGAGYVSLGGSSYQLPKATFQKLASSVSSSGSGQTGLAGLGIDPQHWLQNPQIVGTDTVGGAPVTHIRAGLKVAALLSDLNTFLGKTSSQSTISPADQQKIASAVTNPAIDVWTGKSDHLLRKMTVSLTVGVTGKVSTLFGGLHSAGISLTFQYTGLNQPQTITAPAHVLPYSQFTSKLQGALGALGGLGQSSATSSGQSSGSSSAATKYGHCIQAAGQNVTKMQKCAGLLNGQ